MKFDKSFIKTDYVEINTSLNYSFINVGDKTLNEINIEDLIEKM